MPDPQPAKRQPIHGRTSDTTEPPIPYAELRCRTNFSFLEGASHPDELALRAAELGYRALAVTDRNSVAGVVRAHAAAKTVGLKLLIGAEVTPFDAPPVVLLATDREAYGRLCRLLTVGRRRAPKGECELSFEDIAEHAEGLLACIPIEPDSVSPRRSRCVQDETMRAVQSKHCSPDFGNHTQDRGLGLTEPGSIVFYKEVFVDRCYALAQLHRGADDARLLHRMRQFAEAAGVPLAAANDVHYHVRERQFLHEVLTAIRLGCTVSELGGHRFPNAERHLKPPAEMAALFAGCPEAIARTVEIADRCSFSLDELRYEYPKELCPPGTTAIEHLKRLTWEGAHRRYPAGLPERVRGLIEHELQLIEELRYEAYFLTVWDLVRFARGRDILCQGRGSAANSAVCYCLEVTSVDPGRIDVLFERFVSKERDEAPDIDVDFEHERREEVLQYIYEKYGRDRAGMAATVITYRPRSAVRDVGKALGLSLDRVDAIAKSLERGHDEETLADRLRLRGFDSESLIARQLVGLVSQILGFPRHLSQHVGGMVLTQRPLCEMVPIENAAMPDRTVIQWDKDDLDALGILKVDCLSLGMLTAIRKCLGLIERHRLWRLRDPGANAHGSPNSHQSPVTSHQSPITLTDIPPEDPAVYEMISRADTMGVFQIESRAQMSMLPRLRPKCYYDLVIEVAIVRPGPIQGDMVHPYLRRRSGEEAVEYPDDRIKEVLHKTLGVPIFQEQAMRLAVVAAGFTPGEADQLRRAMGAWRKRGVIDKFRQKLIDGMDANGYSAEFAERLFNQIRGFGEYGFPESHAASFALLVYVSAWLKCHHPAAFTAALLNSQPMGFYAPAQLIDDARKHGVQVLPVDVNASDWDCTLTACGLATVAKPQAAIRLGLRLIRGLSESHAEIIVAARQTDGLFASFADFTRRTRLSNAVLKKLSKADAFAGLGVNRREALWHSLPEQKQLPLFDDEAGRVRPESPTNGASSQSDNSFEQRVDNERAQPGERSRTATMDCSTHPTAHSKRGREDEDDQVALPPMSLQEQVVADYRTAGLSLRGHPLQFVRSVLDELRVVPSRDLATLPVDRRYKVAGLVLLRQRPSTAKGITFVTLEDEFGTANLIVRQKVWERYHQVAARAGAMIAHGQLQRVDSVIHLLVDRMENLSHLLAGVDSRSRDFR